MAIYTNPSEVERIKAASRAAAEVLNIVCAAARPGISTGELDRIAAAAFAKLKAASACLGYKGSSKRCPNYPGHTCLSINEEVVHGIPSDTRILKEGDILSVDVVAEKDGYIGDNARTIAIGQISPDTAKLLQVTEASLYEGIAAAVVGNRVGDISFAIQRHVESHGYGVVRDFVGHGVGRTMHEEPQIPNYGRPHSGEVLKAGMVIAIEPMINRGSYKVKVADDGWTAVAIDGLPSAHFEHTVQITTKGPRILTKV